MKITKARLKQIIKEELSNVAEAEGGELQQALEAYDDWKEEQIARDIHNYDEPTEFNIIKWMSSRQAGSGRKYVHLLGQIANEYGFYKPDMMRGLKMYGSKALQRKGAEALKGYRRKRIKGVDFEEVRKNPDLSPKRHKKPGEIKDDGKYADPKRARPKRMNEELTRQDKTDVKKMVKDELEKLLKKKDTKDQMGEIVKKIMKKLYKDLSLEHPYIIDRIKIWCYIIDVKSIHTDPFAAQHPQASIGDWVYYPKTKLCGLVIGIDNQTGFMQLHDFKSMNLRWVTMNNFGQYKVLWVKVI